MRATSLIFWAQNLFSKTLLALPVAGAEYNVSTYAVGHLSGEFSLELRNSNPHSLVLVLAETRL